ncbi:MAG: hypothetical protein HFH46_02490 [Bacilli bacterium]|nr:hypothetical protein [Bacilli bacterium]
MNSILYSASSTSSTSITMTGLLSMGLLAVAKELDEHDYYVTDNYIQSLPMEKLKELSEVLSSLSDTSEKMPNKQLMLTRKTI